MGPGMEAITSPPHAPCNYATGNIYYTTRNGGGGFANCWVMSSSPGKSVVMFDNCFNYHCLFTVLASSGAHQGFEKGGGCGNGELTWRLIRLNINVQYFWQKAAKSTPVPVYKTISCVRMT